jgi:hypothetical protein
MTDCIPSTTQPGRAYKIAASVWMVLYIALVLGVALAIKHDIVPPGPLRYALAVTPSVPIAGMIFAFSRYMRDSDEYIRALLSRRIVVAAGLTFILSNSWGFMEAFAGAPHIELYWVFVGFCLLYGTAGLFVRDVR